MCPRPTPAAPTPAEPAPATLADVVARVGGVLRPASADTALHIADVTHDSRSAGPGVLFAARPGARADGHAFVGAAVTAGSPAVMVERPVDAPVPQLQVPSVADALGPAAAAVHRDPAAEMALIGVTGTNGKTTTAFMIEAGLSAAGHVTGLIGTIETRIAGVAVAGVRTTPEGSDLQRLLRRMRSDDVTAAAMEVSSHGLALGRVRGIQFAAVGFTNLSQDHLDFHADLEDYYRAKASLFAHDYAATAVINVDDAAGRRLAGETSLEVIGVSADPAAAARAHITDVTSGRDGSSLVVTLDGDRTALRTPLPGDFNVVNAATAFVLLRAAGIPAAAAADGIGAMAAVPGRMEPVDAGQPFAVVVDYAHTPDALERVLAAVRPLGGRTLVVIGCGGDRDTGKRPLMGRVAAQHADVAILTSDNPRSEDPEAILDAVQAGTRGVTGAKVLREPDRATAIGLAVGEATDGDVVVIAGKGHERTQELADRVIEFDDRAVARGALRTQGWDT